MDLRFVSPDLRSLDASGTELLACTVFQDQRPMRGAAGLLDKVLVFGLGARSGFGEGTFRSVIMHLMRALTGLRVRRAVVELPGRAEGMMEAERAAELVLDCVADSPAHDSWWLVEEPSAQRRLSQRAIDERRRAPRAG